MEDIEKFSVTHGLFFEFLLDLIVNGFVIFCSEKIFVIVDSGFSGSVPYFEEDLFF